MAILVDLYDNRSLTAFINKITKVDPFVYQTLFKNNKQDHNSDIIDVETIYGNEKIAQFVHSDETAPRITEKGTKKVQQVKIPKTWEAKIFTARELAEINQIGNIYGDAVSKRNAQKEFIRLELEDLRERVIRLREKMACDAIVTGKIAASQTNIDFEIDFNFVNGTHLITLTNSNLWTHADSNPTSKINEWKRLITKACNASPTIMILGTAAADAFRANTKVGTLLDQNNTRMGALEMTGKYTVGATYIGRLYGLDCYEYMQQYVNSSGVATDMISTDRAILIAPTKDFRTHFGPAWRIQNNSTSEPVFGEFVVEVDHNSNNQMLQWNCEQKSLTTIHDPGCVISAKVV
ncbi:MAG: major capsid protein [Candidatus Paceibacterota bacterium]|jgi:hypothetical protein